MLVVSDVSIVSEVSYIIAVSQEKLGDGGSDTNDQESKRALMKVYLLERENARIAETNQWKRLRGREIEPL